MTFTDRLRKWFKRPLDGFAGGLARLGCTPMTVTVIGLIGNVIAAVAIAMGHIQIGGLIMLVAWPIDALDGALARLTGSASDWGAFADSLTDRYAEYLIFAALLYRFSLQGDTIIAMVVFAAAAGSLLVSYARARAEAQGYSAKEGLMSRVERYLVLVPSLIFNVASWGIWILAVLANLTALQRVWIVRRQAMLRAKTTAGKETRS